VGEETHGTDERDAWFERSVDERLVDVLGHVMLNLRDLPVFACDRSVLNHGSIWFPAYLACLESFFVNARLAAEFFVRMPRRDFNARVFVADWSPPKAAAMRLDRVWEMTSKNIVHFGKDRIPDSLDDWEQEDLSYGALMRINRDAHALLGKLVEAAERDGARHATELRELFQGSRPFSLREATAAHGKEKRAARMKRRYSFQDPYAAVWWGR
jgi:hypothetical protein